MSNALQIAEAPVIFVLRSEEMIFKIKVNKIVHPSQMYDRCSF